VGALRQSSEGQLSVVDKVLRAQARNRRLRRAGAAAVMLALALLVGLWLSPPGRPPLASSPVVVAMPWVARTGTVTGYIEPCSGLGSPMYTSSGARLFSAAATVEALSGQERVKPASHGVYQLVLPTVIAARERVSQNQKFRLDHLAPGRYVILAQYAGSNATTSLDVSVTPGQVADILLPDVCK
jgi:hypothetical protein